MAAKDFTKLEIACCGGEYSVNQDRRTTVAALNVIEEEETEATNSSEGSGADLQAHISVV